MKLSSDYNKLQNKALNWLALISAIWLAVPVSFWVLSGADTERAARIGDAFGTINSLFSGLALFGVGVAIYYQHLQMELQKAESDFAQQEMRKQTAFMQDSALVAALSHLLEYQRQVFKSVQPEAGAFAYTSEELVVIIDEKRGKLAKLKPAIEDWNARRQEEGFDASPQAFARSTGLEWKSYEYYHRTSEVVPALEKISSYLIDLDSAYQRLKPV